MHRRIGLVVALLPVLACSRKPTEAECEAFTDHLVELLVDAGENEKRVRKLGNKHADAMIEACVRGGTIEEVECSLAAESLEALARCKD